MARIRRCHGCGNENPEREPYCANCGLDLEGVGIENTEILQPVVLRTSEASNDNPFSEFMAEAEPTQFRLVFPWGEWVIQDRVIVGRDYRVSPFGMQLKDYELVSGVHAEIWVEGSTLQLLHVGRHPIKVNDLFVHKGESCELRPGDALDFSNQLLVRVKT